MSQKPDISLVVSEYLCNSCGACFAICDHGAISYAETTGGYLFPSIDQSICIHCGLCYEVCPGINFGKTLVSQLPEDPFVGNILSCHVGRAADNEIFRNAQSGGVANALLKHLFETEQIKAAIVAVMKTATPPRGDVLLVKNASELLHTQKSKYTPIPLLSAITQIKKISGGVALVGLPCHMHGLHNLFDLYPSLTKKIFIKIGLVCDRVMTGAAIDFMGNKATDQPINYFIFRDKESPSYPGNPVVQTADGERVILKASLRINIKDFFTPARCRLCFDKLNIFADIVLGDPHGIKGVDRTHGETLVFARTQRGQELVEKAQECKDIVIRPTEPQTAINGQSINQKRLEWAGYMQAWKALGRTQPEYPFHPTQAKNVHVYQARIKHALELDGFASREALLKSADQWLFKQKIRKLLFWPITKAKGIVRRILKEVKK